MENDSTIYALPEPLSCTFRKKVLIIDDVELVCRVVSKQLRSAGFEDVRYASDPRKVMDLLAEYKPDMILLDIFMPHISGLELLQMIRQVREYDDIIILMLSSAGADEKFKSLELGAFGFVQKPITAVNLVQTMTSKFVMASRLGIQ